MERGASTIFNISVKKIVTYLMPRIIICRYMQRRHIITKNNTNYLEEKYC